MNRVGGEHHHGSEGGVGHAVGSYADHAGHVHEALEQGVEHALTYGERFLEMALESAPPLLLGFVLAGLISVFLPQASMRWLRGGRPLGQTLKGMTFGLPLPICSCGVIPMYQSLIRKGTPPAAAMAFLVATPEIGIEAIILSVPFLGFELTGVRLLAAAFVAVVVGWAVGRGLPTQGSAERGGDTGPETARSFGEKFGDASRFAFIEVVDETAAWLLVGIAVAAAIEPSSMAVWLSGVPGWLEVLGFAALGLPVYVCASGATPLAAAMILAGASPGAALAFLLAGPATNVTTFGVLSSLHGTRVAVAFGATVLGAAVLSGIVVDALFGNLTVPAAMGDAHVDGSMIAWVSLGVLTLAFAAAVLRQGPRAFLSTVVSFGGDEHAHG